nr:zinc finger protein 302-like [Onthophagus taurus]
MFEQFNIKDEFQKENRTSKPPDLNEPTMKKAKLTLQNDENGNDLDNHNLAPSKSKGNPCQLCKQAFPSMDELVMHAKIEHTPRKQRTFSVEDIEYFLKVFLKLKKSHCPICHKAILNTLNWRGHMYTHCVSKNISCRVCGKTFTRADHCKNHEARHKVKIEGEMSEEDEFDD